MFTQNNSQYMQQNLQTGQQFQRQYDDNLYKMISFSFPFNNLFLVSLMKRVSKIAKPDSFEKEAYFAFVTGVLGVVNNGNERTYDFNQKIVQKFSLRELCGLAFALKQLAKSDPSVLPYTKFTNSGTGSKSLFLQYREQLQNFDNINTANRQQQFQTQQGQNIRKVNNSINLGFSYGSLKINISLTKADAYNVADVLEKIYNKGISLEIEEQIKRNINTINSELTSNDVNISGAVHIPPVNNPVVIGGSSESQIINNNDTSNVAPMAVSPDQIGQRFLNLATNLQTGSK